MNHEAHEEHKLINMERSEKGFLFHELVSPMKFSCFPFFFVYFVVANLIKKEVM